MSGADRTASRQFDLIVYGATGYTGRLVAEHIARRQAAGENLTWALAGRSLPQLSAVRKAVGAPESTDILRADAHQPSTLRSMAECARCVLSTVGPYQQYGSGLVAACAAAGTDYTDLCGEPMWMREMIDAHSSDAVASGARILFACGFDSLPSELGTWLCQRAARERLGAPVARVKSRVRSFIGGPSGGTVATIAAMARALEADPSIATSLADPFLLTPGFRGPTQPPDDQPGDDPDVGAVVPFMLGPTNRMVVHRSNVLMGKPYGDDFVYDEMALAGGIAPPAPGELPRPGQGPTADQRRNGSFDMLFTGMDPHGRHVQVSMGSALDPGYGTTSQMISETALCLLANPDVDGGIWTPVSALRGRLRDQLETHTCLNWSVLE